MPCRSDTASAKSFLCAVKFACYEQPHTMSDQEPPPPPLGLILGIIIAVDAVILTLLASKGMLARLSPGAQFYYGVMTFGFPLIVYFMLKRRRNRDE